MPEIKESQTSKTPSLLSKAEGAFLALAAGDALGWPQEMRWNIRGASLETGPRIEFREWTRRSGGRYQPYEEVIRPGEYSDDTQLTLAVARSRTSHGTEWFKAFARTELPTWKFYERGGGGATKRAADEWTRGNPPWESRNPKMVRQYFDAGGNGVAMRVLPHALFFSEQENSAALMRDVVLDGSATHGHPRALVGAAVYAHAAWSLLRRTGTLGFGELLDTLIDEASVWSEFPKSDRERSSWFMAADDATNGYQLVWARTVREMHELLEKARKGVRAGALADDHAVLKELGCFGRTKGAGTSSAAAAVYLAARHAPQPEQGILRAAFEMNADTDTLAAMAGGLMGCLSGVEWLPRPWLQVQDAKYLQYMASRVARGPKHADQNPVNPVSNPRLILSHLASMGKEEVSLGGSIRALATPLPDPKPIAKSIVVKAWRLRTIDGQTMYISKVDRLPKESPSDRPTDDSKSMQRTFSTPAGSTPATDLESDRKHSLYTEFRRQWQSNFGPREMTRGEVEESLDLVSSQVKRWLERAEQDGWIRKTSKKPVKFALRGPQLEVKSNA